MATIEVPSRGGDLNIFVIANYVKILKEIHPDVVFAALKKDWWLVSFASTLARVSRVVLYLGIARRMKSPIKNFIVFRLMKAVLMVNSDSLKGDMLKYPKLFGHHNVIRVYNGFERPSVEGESLDLRTRFDLPPETVLVGCAGRFSPQKGFDLLPDILSALPNHVHVVHAGDGEYEDTIKAAINARSESKRIHFVGYQSNMQAFFRSIDLFLLCSRNEGMANVLNEAMSFGIPVVSTRVPGSEELLAHGKYGVLTDVNDVQAMAEGIRSIVIGERVFQSADLRQWIDQEFGFQKMILETNRLFFETELK